MFFSAFPDQHWAIDEQFVEGPNIVTRFTLTGTHDGSFLGIPATAKKWPSGVPPSMSFATVSSLKAAFSWTCPRYCGIVGLPHELASNFH